MDALQLFPVPSSLSDDFCLTVPSRSVRTVRNTSKRMPGFDAIRLRSCGCRRTTEANHTKLLNVNCAFICVTVAGSLHTHTHAHYSTVRYQYLTHGNDDRSRGYHKCLLAILKSYKERFSVRTGTRGRGARVRLEWVAANLALPCHESVSRGAIGAGHFVPHCSFCSSWYLPSVNMLRRALHLLALLYSVFLSLSIYSRHLVL